MYSSFVLLLVWSRSSISCRSVRVHGFVKVLFIVPIVVLCFALVQKVSTYSPESNFFTLVWNETFLSIVATWRGGKMMHLKYVKFTFGMVNLFLTKLFGLEEMCGHYIQGHGFNRRKVMESYVVLHTHRLRCIGNTCHLIIFGVHWNVQCLVCV